MKIDYNVANPEPFIRASKDYLGENGVVGMIAYGTQKEGAAFRNLCRAKGLNFDEYNEVAKNLDLYRKSEKWKSLIDECQKFVGVVDSFSIHPCAYVLLSEPIDEELGIIKAKENYVCLLDSTTADYYKYLKNDYLTVTVWEIISEVYKLINEPIDSIESLTKKLDDQVWNLYKDGITTTLNQTGSNFARPKVMTYKPKQVSELSAFVAAIRPGFSSMVDTFLNRVPFSYHIKEFDDLLNDSHNFVLYQENVMTALQYAGFPSDETYSLLKAIAKKKPGIIEPIEERFKKGFGDRLGDIENKDDIVNRVWQIVVDNVGYSFNSSHSLATALDSLYGAYLKSKHPLEYYTVVLNIYHDNMDETNKIIDELAYFNIKLEPIKFRYSKVNYRYNKDTWSIYKGVASLKFLNEIVSTELYELGKNEYTCFIDLYYDILYNTSCDRRQLEILIKSDFFSEFGSIGKLLDILEECINGKNRLTKSLKDKSKEKRLIELKLYEKELVHYTEVNEKELIKFKVDNNLPLDIDPKKSNREFVILDTTIKTNYTLVELFKIKTGEKITAKKRKSCKGIYFDKGDTIIISRMTLENRWYEKDGKWQQYEDKDNRKELIIQKYQSLNNEEE